MSLKPLKKSDLEKGWMKKRRDKAIRILPEYHLIVTEGTETEPQYFQAVKDIINRKYRDKIQLDVFGEGDMSPSRKKGHEKARKNGMNHRNAEGCSLTLPGRSSVFQIAREKVLPKRSEAAACCKMLPCKRRRPPEQRRVSGTASGE